MAIDLSERARRADEEFPERVRRLRRRQGFTQMELAKLSGLPRETIGRWERGVAKPYGGKTVRRVCAILRCAPDYLLWGVKED